jgi:adenylate cyclase class 2
MAKETEIKLQIADLKAFDRKLKKLGAKTVGDGGGRVHEFNTIFDTPEGGLAKHGQLLRIRMETPSSSKSPGKNRKPALTRQDRPRAVLTFKQPSVRAVDEDGGRFKVRDETELEVADPAALTKIFEGLGMRGWFTYEKYRTTWKLGTAQRWAKDLLIEVDETPVGVYVELEGSPEAIEQAAEALGYSRKDYLTKNYLTLYAEDCRRRGVPPGNMLFDPRKK